MSTFQIVIVGTGFIGASHANAIKEMPGVKLAGIVEKDEERGKAAANKNGCAWYPSFEEMTLNKTPDLAIIALPTFLHEEYVIKAANAKINVLCEKPVTLSLESFDRMTKACEENNVRFMVAQVVRWWPEYVETRKLIKSNTIGSIRVISLARLAQHPNWSTWHTDPQKSGGALFDLHIHDIDYLYSLFGMPKNVYAIGWKSQYGCWNHVVSNLCWKDGTKAVVEASMDMKGGFPFTNELRVAGEMGTIDYRFTAGVNIKDGNQSSGMLVCQEGGNACQKEVVQYDPFRAEVSAYISAIAEKRQAPIPTEQSRCVLQVVQAIEQSLETNQCIKL
ncbi:MAG: Gfo/Idh/MocA family oxidoreductase [Christensenella sp.]|nr:Gfo/Idh/MocA family oxidoreductase [Christensenella sp.]